MEILNRYIITSDGTKFKWDGGNVTQKNKAKAYEMGFSNCESRQALKKLTYDIEYKCSDGTKFDGPLGSQNASQHEWHLMRLKTAKEIADILYPGTMSKEEYTLHLVDRYQRLQSLLHLNCEIYF